MQTLDATFCDHSERSFCANEDVRGVKPCRAFPRTPAGFYHLPRGENDGL